jgi:hypothetical protein
MTLLLTSAATLFLAEMQLNAARSAMQGKVDFIPCRHPEHPHKGRNTFHGPCTAKIDKEGTLLPHRKCHEDGAARRQFIYR